MDKIWAAEQAKEIDRLSSQDHGVPSLHLMEEAGQALYRLALRVWKPGTRYMILAGPGNNGGDALVLARLLFDAGFALDVFDVRDDKSQESEERAYQKQQIIIRKIPFPRFAGNFPQNKDQVIVDGLLGVGFHGKLRPGAIKDCLSAAAKVQARAVIAIDLPSGLDADLWQQDKAILPATHTQTFGAAKAVHRADPSRLACGAISVAPLSFPKEAQDAVLAKAKPSLSYQDQKASLGQIWKGLAPDAHKYTRGHVLVVGGSAGKCGAPLLTAEAALRAGSGWVSVAPLSDAFAPAWPKHFTYEDFALEGEIPRDKLIAFVKERRVKAIAFGPGTMHNPLKHDLLIELHKLQSSDGHFLLFDAGCLQNFKKTCGLLRFDPKRTLLTPHPGEWLKLSDEQKSLDGLPDLAAASKFAEGMGVSIIYKSSTPIVIHPGAISVQKAGTNALGKAGSGDVFAGLALAFGAAGHDAPEAAAQAYALLRQAAEAASQKLSPHGLSPLDILHSLI